MLKFSAANSKTKALKQVKELQKFLKNGRKIYSLDLLSGWSCPFAELCKSKVVTIGNKRKLVDGPYTKFRCFSASQEIAYPNVYNSRKHNYDLLKSSSDKTQLIQQSMPDNLGICRIHVAGDFFNPSYLQAWMQIAQQNPDRLFYAYTKSLIYWINLYQEIESIPNLVLTASYGGSSGDLIRVHNLRYAKVIYHPSEAKKMPIDHDDSHAARPSLRNKNFCLLLHGVQPAKSEASIALTRLRKEKVKFSYGSK
jgi:hypothetical protein